MILTRDPEDFRVDEQLAYAPSGEGEHLFLQIEKTDLTTAEALRRLGLTDFGIAGHKDRAAITTQWVSTRQTNFRREAEGVRVLSESRHTNKIRRGHNRANRFSIVIRQAPSAAQEEARTALQTLAARGVPNRFGSQRFGRYGDNAERALAFVRGEAKPPRNRKLRDLMLSALQSEIFNRLLDVRLDRGLLDVALPGDVMTKHATGGMFVVEDPEAETPRVQALEISPTGFLPGRKVGPAHALEEEILEASGLSAEDLARMGKGTRRALRFPLDPTATITALEQDCFRLEVTLPSGAYATELLLRLGVTSIRAS